MTRAKDILDELTKDELLAWVRTKFISPPKRSEILYLRWNKQSGDLLRDQQAETRSLGGIDFAERDRLAKRFNESTCSKDRLAILDLMAPYEKAMSDHLKRCQALEVRQKRVDKLYEQIDIERQKEQRQ